MHIGVDVIVYSWETVYQSLIYGSVAEPNSHKRTTNTMYKKISYFFVVAVVAIAMSSCRSVAVPKAVNTVHPVGWEELNLTRKDYIILKTVSADASVSWTETSKRLKISDENGEFVATFKKEKMKTMFGKEIGFRLDDVKGIVRIGLLKNDYNVDDLGLQADPYWFSRNMATYRLINAAKMAGADGIIEPIVSTNVEQIGKKIVFKTTVSGKLIKLKPDGK